MDLRKGHWEETATTLLDFYVISVKLRRKTFVGKKKKFVEKIEEKGKIFLFVFRSLSFSWHSRYRHKVSGIHRCGGQTVSKSFGSAHSHGHYLDNS